MKERLGFAETGPFFCLYQVSVSPVYSFCPDVFSFTFLIYTINWRESDRKILILAIPILWKKFDITICAPTNGNINVQMRSPDDAMSINSSLSVKMAETVCGKSSQIMKPLLVINTPTMIPRRSVCFTRSIFCAP